MSIAVAVYPCLATWPKLRMLPMQKTVALLGLCFLCVNPSRGEADIAAINNQPRPAYNDNFENSKRLCGAHVRVRAFNTFATSEIGEPEHSGNVAERSLWWTWKSPCDGTLFVAVNRLGGLPHLIAIYTGDTLTQLTQVAFEFGSAVLDVKANTAYHIVVDDSPFGSSTNRVLFHLSLRRPPRNDDFAHRHGLRGANIHLVGSVVGATLEPGELRPYLDSTHTVWWKWKAPEDGRYTFAAVSTDMNPLLALYRNELSEDALIDLPFTGPGFAEINIPVVAGDVIAVSVGGKIQVPRGKFNLTIRRTPPPGNGSFASRFDLVNGFGIGSNEGDDDPDEYQRSSIWWQFTPSSNGWHTIQARIAITNAVPAPTFLADLKLYSGDRLKNLVNIPTTGEFEDSTSFPSFYLSAGTNYAIQVNEANGRFGEVTVRAQFHSSPANDNFEDAAIISVSPAEIVATTAWATAELGEPVFDFSGVSVWWRWVAPSNGAYAISADFLGGGYDAFSGETLTELVPVTILSSNPDGIVFEATEGTAYHIAVRTVFPGFLVSFRLTSSIRPALP